MSIFKKITLLFFISLFLMFIISYQIEKINTQRVEVILTQKYLQDAKKVFSWLGTSSPQALKGKLHSLGLTPVDTNTSTTKMQTLLSQAHSFGGLRILKSNEGDYLLSIHYLDDALLLHDKELQYTLKDQWVLNMLVLLDIIVLIIIFLVILKMLFPLKQISAKMKDFANGAYQSRVDIDSKDEIGEVAQTYNRMAQKLQELITAREELLRDVGHELRTPISKGFFAVEVLEPSASKDLIQRSLSELERLSREILEIEKLHTLQKMHFKTFHVETLILEALSKLIHEDESKITIEIHDNFSIQGDLNYLAIALKNLIDNALKYTQEYPIVIVAEDYTLTVANRGEPFKKEISYYLAPFTRENDSRTDKGYGLGLNIVKKILKKHVLTLNYAYNEGKHLFSICFRA